MQPMDIEQMLKDAGRHFEVRRFKEAASLYEQILEEDPRHGEALGNLGSVCFARGDLDAAATYYAACRKQAPGTHMAGLGLAKVRMAQGRPDDALKLLQEMNRAGELPPRAMGEFYKLLGIIYAGKEDWGVAATFFRKYQQEAPKELDPWLCLGRLAISSGDGDGLVETLESMVAGFPDYAQARMDLVRLLGERGGYQAIKDSLDRVLARNPDNLPVYNLLAIASLEHRKYAYAYLYFLRARARYPDFSRREYPGLARMEVFS
jgi:tetratricopeptide (TPR) repeat protein